MRQQGIHVGEVLLFARGTLVGQAFFMAGNNATDVRVDDRLVGAERDRALADALVAAAATGVRRGARVVVAASRLAWKVCIPLVTGNSGTGPSTGNRERSTPPPITAPIGMIPQTSVLRAPCTRPNTSFGMIEW